MILIFSQQNEDSTNQVIDWLLYKNHPFIRLNTSDILDAEKFSIILNNDGANIFLKIHGKELNINNIGSVWFKRWWEVLSLNEDIKNLEFKSALNKNINIEIKSISSYLFWKLRDRYWLNYFDNVHISKLIQMEIAINIGLSIPNTIISNMQDDFISFLQKNPETITKPINEALSYKEYAFYTSSINMEDISWYEKKMFPSMLQKKVKKAFEIRVFFLDEYFYPIAIFSQQNDNTEIDSRKIDFSNPIRMVKYNIPMDLQIKLKKMAKLLNLNSGSFDLIKTDAGDYVFLEINPVGQFGFVSAIYNNCIEKDIANWLIEKDKLYGKGN